MLVDKEDWFINKKILNLEIRILQEKAVRYYFWQKFRSLAEEKCELVCTAGRWVNWYNYFESNLEISSKVEAKHAS